MVSSYVFIIIIIILAVPPSSIGIIASPIPDNFFSGLQLNLTCRTELDAAVNTEQNVTMTWTKSGSSINPFRISISSPQRVHFSPQIYESSLIFSSLSVYSDDEGEYVCSVSVKPLENPQLFLASPTIRSSQRVRIDCKEVLAITELFKVAIIIAVLLIMIFLMM